MQQEQQTSSPHFTTIMAKSKAVSKKQEKAANAPLTTKVANGSPYQLDPAQVERAAKALVSHMKQHAEEKNKKAAVQNLADDEDEAQVNDQPIMLSLSTKKHINNTTSLKPTKMSVYTAGSFWSLSLMILQLPPTFNHPRRCTCMHLYQRPPARVQGPGCIRRLPCHPPPESCSRAWCG